MSAPGILWLTRDFRLTDAAALCAALADGPLLPVFFVDDLLMAQGSASRWRLEQALRAFDAVLRRRGGQGVCVLRGAPERMLPDLLRRTGARRVHQADWPAPQMRALQERVRRALGPEGLVLHAGHLLVHPRMVRTQQGGVYRVYTPFARALKAVGADRPGPAAPARFAMWQGGPEGEELRSLDLAPDMYRGRAVLARFALPAGAEAAQARLADFLAHAEGYGAERDRPDIEATSGLSDYLATGEIGTREIWATAMAAAEANPAQAAGIGKFLSEVIWREFAWHLLIDFPALPERAWRAEWEGFAWRAENPDHAAWCRGETGVALVDAGLREMRVTGRMHNRVRMVVASWLTKHALTDWRLGLRHFEDSLTDWDPAANAMNWQWVAGCGPDAAPYFRVFNPEKQAQQYDPKAAYRRRWLAGWMGAPGPEARAYLESVPPGWALRPLWQPVRGDAALAEGRARALEAYGRFRAAQDA